MKNLSLLLIVIMLISACSKDKLCGQIEGHYRLTEITSSGITKSVPDTGVDSRINPNAVFANNIIIDGNQNITGYTGSKGFVTFHSDRINCSRVKEVMPTYFISGSDNVTYKYIKI